MLSKNPSLTDRFALNTAFTKNARSAWQMIIKLASTSRPASILLPSYIGHTDKEGSGIFDPVELSGCPFEFYQLDDDFSPNIKDLREKLSEGVDVLLVVHYFGFPRAPLRLIRKLCSDAGVVLVEDCAHMFTLSSSPQSPGSVGDYSFYSVHKYLATFTGGIARSNKPGVLLAPPCGLMADPAVVNFIARTDLQAIRRIRRRNFTQYQNELCETDGISCLFQLESPDNPQSFPVLVRGGLRERLYFYLIERGLPTTALYYRLIKQISPRKFPWSHETANSILNLPLHQDISRADILSLTSEIKRFMKDNY